MSDSKKITERLANVAIAIIAICLGGILVRNYFSIAQATCKGNDANEREVRVGEQFELSSINGGQDRQTLVLALSTTCHFCSESLPFYQQIVKERNEHTTRIIAVLPQTSDEGRAYLNHHDIQVDEIKHARLDAIGISGTPTLLLIDRNGVVVDSWVGKLPEAEEAKVLERVRTKREQ